jgi:hypothetical protein
MCEQILRRVAGIATETGLTNHQRYLKMWEMMQDQNEEVALAFDDHHRSTAFLKIFTVIRS